MHGEDIRISREHYRNQVRGLLLVLWNVYNFLVINAIIDKWEPTFNKVQFKPSHILDRWILSRLNGNIKNVTQALEDFDTPQAVGQAEIIFIHDLSNWYVRRIRDRVGPTVPEGKDKIDAYQTLWTVLVEYTKVLAPIVPFISEEIYRNLTGEESVHLVEWPGFNKELDKPQVEKDMDNGMKLASVAHALRRDGKVKVRIPLKQLNYTGPEELSEEVKKVVLEEINVYELLYKGKSGQYIASGDTSGNNQDLLAGQARELVRQIQELRKKEGCALDEKITVFAPSWPKDFEDYIKKQTLAKKLIKGKEFKIERTT